MRVNMVTRKTNKPEIADSPSMDAETTNVLDVIIELKNPDSYMPTMATDGSACYDLYASEDVLLSPREIKPIPTGVKMQIPKGYVGLLFPRSGISKNTYLRLANNVGVIDSDYRGEVMPLMENIWFTDARNQRLPSIWDLKGDYREDFSAGYFTVRTYEIKKGDRVAQLMILPVPATRLVAGKVDQTERGEGGFGSTGK